MNPLKKNIDEAIYLLTEKPIFSTQIERVMIMNEIMSKYNDLPQPIRFGTCLQELLSRVSIPLEPYDLLAGRCVDRELTEEEEAVYQAFIAHPDYPRHHIFLDSGHCTYSWEILMELGLPGMKEYVLQQKEKFRGDEEKQIFLTGMLMAYDAVAAFMLRYASEAERIGNLSLAAALRRGATSKTNDFYSGLQLLWTIEFIVCSYITPNPTLTLGRIDQLLYPAYMEGIRNGTLTNETVEALITDFYCKHNLNMGRGEHQIGDKTNSTTFERIFNFDAPQYMQLGGLNAELQPTVNELTYLFVKCIVPEFKNPVAVFQYHTGLDQEHPELWKMVVEKGLKSAPLMIYNDSEVTACLLRMGFPVEDAVKHAHFGCNWGSLGENSHWSATGPNSRQLNAFLSKKEEEEFEEVERKLHGQTHAVGELMDAIRSVAAQDGEGSIEEIYDKFWKTMADNMDLRYAAYELEYRLRCRKPSTMIKFSDCFLRNPIENAQSNAICAKYQTRTTSFVFFANVVDIFVAVEKLVYQDKVLTLKQLLEVVDANFEGYPEILAMCRNIDKYGSDSPVSNQWATRLMDKFFQVVVDAFMPYYRSSHIVALPCTQCDNGHLRRGLIYGATPDGRLANTAFAHNTRPSNGACTNGLTGMFNSLLSMPKATRISGALNVDVDPKQFDGEAGHAMFGAILANYFNRGGLHAQISSASLEDLIDAQEHPEAHRDLRVRVTGYSGIFVDICKKLQDDIIDRFQ